MVSLDTASLETSAALVLDDGDGRALPALVAAQVRFDGLTRVHWVGVGDAGPEPGDRAAARAAETWRRRPHVADGVVASVTCPVLVLPTGP